MSVANAASSYVPAAEVVDILRAQGRPVTQTESCWWYAPYGQRRLFHAFPNHRLITPSAAELKQVFQANPEAYAVRFLSPTTAAGGAESFQWTCRQTFELEALDSKDRNTVRKGLKNCTVRQLSFDELARDGETAQLDTLRRLGRELKSLSTTQRLSQHRAYQAWGAFVEDQLAAFAINLRVENWVHIQVNRSATELLKFNPNNALLYVMTQQLLTDPEVEAVSYGWEPLAPLTTLDRFKLSMGYVKEPVRQNIVLAPWLRYAVNPLTRRLIRQAATWRSGDQRLQRLAGVCRYISRPAENNG